MTRILIPSDLPILGQYFGNYFIEIAYPWLLLGLLLLPLIFLIIRTTPPQPRTIGFGPLDLIKKLGLRSGMPARLPIWLGMLRLLIIALLIIASSHIVIIPPANDRADIQSYSAEYSNLFQDLSQSQDGLLIIVGNAWASANDWDQRIALLQRILDDVAELSLSASLMKTSYLNDGDATSVDEKDIKASIDQSQFIEALAPAAGLSNLDPIMNYLNSLTEKQQIIWLLDGSETMAQVDSIRQHSQTANFELLAAQNKPSSVMIREVSLFEDSMIWIKLQRLKPFDKEQSVRVILNHGDAPLIFPVIFQQNEDFSEIKEQIPAEILSAIKRIDIIGEKTVAASYYFPNSEFMPKIALLSYAQFNQQPHYNGRNYIAAALSGQATSVDQWERVEGKNNNLAIILDMIDNDPHVIFMPDQPELSPDEIDSVAEWLEGGGVLIRFAGPQMMESLNRFEINSNVKSQKILPSELALDSRILGGNLTWDQPQGLLKAELEFWSENIDNLYRDDIRIYEHSLISEDSQSFETLLRLSDRTPLITLHQRGKGTLIFIHTTASPLWSNWSETPIFPHLINRLSLGFSHGRSSKGDIVAQPVSLINGFNQTIEAYPWAPSIEIKSDGSKFSHDRLDGSSSKLWPFIGQYQSRDGAHYSINFSDLPFPPSRELADATLSIDDLDEQAILSLRVPLIFLAIILIVMDFFAAIIIYAPLPKQKASVNIMIYIVAGFYFTLLMVPETAKAQAVNNITIKPIISQHDELQLSYIKSADNALNEKMRAGLWGLSLILRQRTSIEPGEPMAIDLEADGDLYRYPMIYLTQSNARLLTAEARDKLRGYLNHGGVLVVDLVNIRGRGVQVRRTAEDIATGLGIAQINPIKEGDGHLLKNSFYRLKSISGIWNDGITFVEKTSRLVHDNVSRVVIGNFDWVGAWAQLDGASSNNEQYLYPLVSNDPNQREYAYRFGVNLVMYAILGTYKSDWVHR